MERKKKALEITLPFLGGALSLVVLTLFLEAIFHSSRVSFFSQLNFLQQATVLLNSLFLLFAPIMLLGLILYFFSIAIFSMKRVLRAIYFGYLFLFIVWLFILILSHLDTFAYTAFSKTIFLLPFLANIIILFLILEISVFLSARKGQDFSNFFWVHRKPVLSVIGILCIASAIPLFIISGRLHASLMEIGREREFTADSNPVSLPNIILFAADGLDCDRLGVYGYPRGTTPNLNRYENSILYTRAYSNCGNSRGSIMSIFTGKSPITTKLIYPPDILHGADAFKHLPSILARLGYYTVDINDGFFGSPEKSNLRYGFHQENGYDTGLATGFSAWDRFLCSISDESYFLSNLFERHVAKVIFMSTSSIRLFKSFQTHFLESRFSFQQFMKTGEGTSLTDRKRIDILKGIIRESRDPFFAHIHLMVTHGPGFDPPYRKFSLKENQEEFVSPQRTLEEDLLLRNAKDPAIIQHRRTLWDRYDDSVLTVDHYFGEIVETLRETGKLEKTLLLFLTDHGRRTSSESDLGKVFYPLPLIVYMPGQEERIIIDHPVQYLDITPSLLRFIDQPVPDWMEGNIIFDKSMDDLHFSSGQMIAVMTTVSKKLLAGFALKTEFGPPHYGIDIFQLISDEKLYLYSRNSKARNLYDISDPFSLQKIPEQELVNDYHDSLCELLEEKGIYLSEEP